jgi:hypothetical protein
MAIHFLDDPIVAGILQGILDIAGPNFTPPYDSSNQPSDGIAFNSEDLIQFQLPGGGALSGTSEPGFTESISSAINSMLAALAPFISAYALILPIIGVIRGIIEIICALMNPFAVIAAVIRLFRKWLPPLLALFPPLAGLIIILNIIKTILAIIFFIMTVVIPTIELIKKNIEVMAAAVSGGADKSDQQVEAGRQKILDLLAELLQQSGILSVLQPILELIFSILGLTSGFPCEEGNIDVSLIPFEGDTGEDCPSCSSCLPIVSDRSAAPSGIGAIISSSFCDYNPFFVYQLITINPDIQELESYIQSKEVQLEGCLDEPIRFARPVGATQDTSLIKVKLTSRRGTARTITVPVLDIDGNNLKIMSPLARLFMGVVNYEIEIDYDMMVLNGIMGVACHPDVRSIKDNLKKRFADLDRTVLDRYPEIAPLKDEYNDMFNAHRGYLGQLGDSFNRYSDVVEELTGDELDKATDDILNELDGIRDDMIGLLSSFANSMKNKMRRRLSKASDTSATDLEVDKITVRADNVDKAIITVRPRDITGSVLIKNMPSDVEISVDIFSTFGTISNKQTDNSSGVVTAELTSPCIGSANITAKVNGEFVTQATDTGSYTKILNVRFISKTVLPTRRKRSKPSPDSAVNTGSNIEKSPRR